MNRLSPLIVDIDYVIALIVIFFPIFPFSTLTCPIEMILLFGFRLTQIVQLIAFILIIASGLAFITTFIIISIPFRHELPK